MCSRRLLIGKLVIAFLVSVVIVSCANDDYVPEQMTDGTFEGFGEGRGGIIKVAIDVRDHRIDVVRVLAQSESLSAIDNYEKLGLLIQSGTLAGIALKTGLDEEILNESLERYNSFQISGMDDDYHRSGIEMPVPLNKAPYYAVEVKPAIHHTMGGIHIDSKARALDKDGNPIEGLFACGEVTGGVHGGNRLGGNGVADIVVFGRIAGREAADNIKNQMKNWH